jgi:hypothetical protein
VAVGEVDTLDTPSVSGALEASLMGISCAAAILTMLYAMGMFGGKEKRRREEYLSR